jgi:hypothetical protein
MGPWQVGTDQRIKINERTANPCVVKNGKMRVLVRSTWYSLVILERTSQATKITSQRLSNRVNHKLTSTLSNEALYFLFDPGAQEIFRILRLVMLPHVWLIVGPSGAGNLLWLRGKTWTRVWTQPGNCGQLHLLIG